MKLAVTKRSPEGHKLRLGQRIIQNSRQLPHNHDESVGRYMTMTIDVKMSTTLKERRMMNKKQRRATALAFLHQSLSDICIATAMRPRYLQKRHRAIVVNVDQLADGLQLVEVERQRILGTVELHLLLDECGTNSQSPNTIPQTLHIVMVSHWETGHHPEPL